MHFFQFCCENWRKNEQSLTLELTFQIMCLIPTRNRNLPHYSSSTSYLLENREKTLYRIILEVHPHKRFHGQQIAFK